MAAKVANALEEDGITEELGTLCYRELWILAQEDVK